tara:strand:- start:1788 stop:3182 length:1395 start_codon:yes stop_codon:yes gene_type:complete
LSENSDKAWSGRFGGTTEELMERFNASIGFDRRLYRVDIEGSRVQARALHESGHLSESELAEALGGLDRVEKEIEADSLPLTDDLEDIHMAVEKRLIELVGPVGGKIHSGRSRNDQVALDERLYLREAIAGTDDRLQTLQSAVVDLAEAHLDTILPGYTHVQQAQPIRLAHWAMALFWMLDRDRGRFRDCWSRANASPLGSGALGGSAYPVDREKMASELGLERVTENSIDAVSDRDALLEYLSAAAITMMHLSRFCEDLILWSSSEFGFVELDDAYATGSSMMPQKKNPDSLELVRGKTGRVYGNLAALLTVMKGVPLTYSKDMQEDKEPLFDTIDTLWMCLAVFTGAWSTMRIRPDRMRSGLDGAILATDLADYLSRKGVPFRDCHRIVGRLVRESLDEGKRLDELGLDSLRAVSAVFEADVSSVLSPENSTNDRNLPGGTGRDAIVRQIEAARQITSASIV